MVMSIRSYVLDSIIVNAWICVKNSGSHVSQLAYTREIARFGNENVPFPNLVVLFDIRYQVQPIIECLMT